MVNIPLARQHMAGTDGARYQRFYERLSSAGKLLAQFQRPGAGPFIKLYDIRDLPCL
jgi:hypothetical protein